MVLLQLLSIQLETLRENLQHCLSWLRWASLCFCFSVTFVLFRNKDVDTGMKLCFIFLMIHETFSLNKTFCHWKRINLRMARNTKDTCKKIKKPLTRRPNSLCVCVCVCSSLQGRGNHAPFWQNNVGPLHNHIGYIAANSLPMKGDMSRRVQISCRQSGIMTWLFYNWTFRGAE